MTCERCHTVIEAGDLRCAICALPVAAGPRLVRSQYAQVLRCTSCAAAVAFSPSVRAPHCAFCGAVMEIEQPADPIETAHARVPFRVSRVRAEASLRGWLAARGYFAPAALHDEAVLESLTPLCWAAWVVTAHAQVAWTADSNQGARRAAWAPHAGGVSLRFDRIVVPASRGLEADECELLAPFYDVSRAVSVDAVIPDDEDDVVIETFDAQRSAARAIVHEAIEREARTRVEPYIPGTRHRKIHVACMLEHQTTDRVVLPAWVLAYRYRGRVYRAIVHGQRPEIVFGRAPIDGRKVARLAATVLAGSVAIAMLVLLLTGCGGEPHTPIDAPDFTEKCLATGTFAPLTGRAAVKGTLNVHVDAGGLIKVDTTSTLLLAMDLVQTGTDVAVTAEVCTIEVPDVPLAGQDMPIRFEVPEATIRSVGTVGGTATLSSADQACADFTAQPITLVLGARLDPATAATAPLPVADDSGAFPVCAPPGSSCATATGTACACDQELDTFPGATLIAHDVPAVDLDQVYVALRTTFSLTGKVFSTDSVRGTIAASLESSVLACKLSDGTPCSLQNVRTVRTLNPVVTQQDGNPSAFRAVRIDPALSCADIIAQQAILFPR